MWKRMLKQRGFRQIPELSEGATFLRKWGAIGILIGAGMIYLAIFTTVMTWFVLFVLKSIEMRLERRRTDVRNGGQDTDTGAKR